MTMIVSGIPTKKALKAAVASGVLFEVYDPALLPEWRKYGEYFSPYRLPLGAAIVVTNHPKRSWFAEIIQTEKGLQVK